MEQTHWTEIVLIVAFLATLGAIAYASRDYWLPLLRGKKKAPPAPPTTAKPTTAKPPSSTPPSPPSTAPPSTTTTTTSTSGPLLITIPIIVLCFLLSLAVFFVERNGSRLGTFLHGGLLFRNLRPITWFLIMAFLLLGSTAFVLYSIEPSEALLIAAIALVSTGVILALTLFDRIPNRAILGLFATALLITGTVLASLGQTANGVTMILFGILAGISFYLLFRRTPSAKSFDLTQVTSLVNETTPTTAQRIQLFKRLQDLETQLQTALDTSTDQEQKNKLSNALDSIRARLRTIETETYLEKADAYLDRTDLNGDLQELEGKLGVLDAFAETLQQKAMAGSIGLQKRIRDTETRIRQAQDELQETIRNEIRKTKPVPKEDDVRDLLERLATLPKYNFEFRLMEPTALQTTLEEMETLKVQLRDTADLIEDKAQKKRLLAALKTLNLSITQASLFALDIEERSEDPQLVFEDELTRIKNVPKLTKADSLAAATKNLARLRTLKRYMREATPEQIQALDTAIAEAETNTASFLGVDQFESAFKTKLDQVPQTYRDLDEAAIESLKNLEGDLQKRLELVQSLPGTNAEQNEIKKNLTAVRARVLLATASQKEEASGQTETVLDQILRRAEEIPQELDALAVTELAEATKEIETLREAVNLHRDELTGEARKEANRAYNSLNKQYTQAEFAKTKFGREVS